MKRILLLSAVALFTAAMASAQCTPDPAYTTAGVYPDSATGFVAGCIDVPYSQLVTNVVPLDTCVEVVPGLPCVTLVFDSVVITSVTGLPPGFSYVCYDGDNTVSPVDGCAFEGNTIGCVLITGTAAAGDEGNYPLLISTDAYLAGGSTPAASIDVDYYTIVITTTCATGIVEATTSKFNLYPNPASETFTLGGLAGLDVSEVSIMNAAGKVLSTQNGISSASIDMNVSNLADGVYFVRVSHGTSVDVVRFVKD